MRQLFRLLVVLAQTLVLAHAAEAADRIESVRFSFQADGPIRSAPLVHRGVLYFGSGDGSLHAIDAKTGVPRWRLRIGGAITSTPAVSGGRILAASRDGALYSVDARTGRVVWRHRFGADLGPQNYWDYFSSSPVVRDGCIFIGSGDGHVYALDPRDGRVLWSFDAGSRVRSTVAVQDGLVVFGTMSGRVMAIDESVGALRWSFSTDGAAKKFDDDGNDTTSVFASPTIAGQTVTIGARDGFVYALDLATGKLMWKTTHDGSSWILSTAYDGKTLYVGSGSALIVQAADPATGAERWRSSTRGAAFGAVTLAGDALLFADFSGTLYAIDKDSGASRWQFPLGSRSLATPLVANGIVYCGSDNGIMFALTMGQGTAAPVHARRIVYADGMKSTKAYAWFKNGVDAALLGQFKGAGYEQLDGAQLEAFMREAVANPAASVVVFADNKIPALLADESGDKALIRQYLDAGGKVVLLGPNPLAYRSDPETGEVTDIDFAVPRKVFGIAYPEPNIGGGFYASMATPAGRGIGLRSASISYLPIEATPVPGLTVLALDEYGKSSSWLQGYGGPRGTGLLQLNLPRQDLADIAEFRAAIEFGVSWGSEW